MINPSLPTDEAARLRALYRYEILDTPSEQEYDDIALLAAQICGTPIASISLIDENRQWLKAKIGLTDAEAPRNVTFCAHVVAPEQPQMIIVADTLKDERFFDNPLVTGDPNIRFYAGAPLITPDNFTLGSLCVIDREPRELSDGQLTALQALARQVTTRLELRRTTSLLRAANEELRNLSLTDDLTGLFNRRGFLFHAEQQLKLFRSRINEYNLWMIIADMDGLKRINDTYGHEEGSAAISKCADILRKTFRSADIIARLSGDEFAVLVINAADSADDKFLERLHANINKYNSASDKSYSLSISVGAIPVAFDDESTIEEIMNAADQVMYSDKRARRENNLQS